MEKVTKERGGICLWCNCLFVKSPLCSPKCEEAWATICDDPLIAYDQVELFKLAPWFMELDKGTKFRFDQALTLVHKVAKVKFGLVGPHDWPPLDPRTKLRPIVLQSRKALPGDRLPGDWCYPIQRGWTVDPMDRVVHGLLDVQGRLGRLYNELIAPEGCLTKEEVKSLKQNAQFLSDIIEDAEEVLTMQLVEG
jgi:hypothetical protein